MDVPELIQYGIHDPLLKIQEKLYHLFIFYFKNVIKYE